MIVPICVKFKIKHSFNYTLSIQIENASIRCSERFVFYSMIRNNWRHLLKNAIRFYSIGRLTHVAALKCHLSKHLFQCTNVSQPVFCVEPLKSLQTILKIKIVCRNQCFVTNLCFAPCAFHSKGCHFMRLLVAEVSVHSVHGKLFTFLA